MHWQYNPYAVPLFIAAIISTVLGIYAWRRRTTPGAGTLALLMLAVTVWSLGYALELSSIDLPPKVFWAKVQYLGISTVPLAWLALQAQYTGQEKWLTRRNLTLLAVIPLVTLLLAWTNEAHGLIWSRVDLYSSGSLIMVEFTHGPAFWVYWGYSQLLMVVSVVLLLQSLVHSQRIYRGQVSAMLVGALAPWAGNALYLSGLNPFPGLDLTPFAFALSGIAAAWAVFLFRLLDIMPIAHDAVIESMSDGVIVLDAQGRIVDLNPVAQQILDRSASDTIGALASQVLPDGLYETGLLDNSTITHNEVVLGEGETQCQYDMRTSSLYDKRNRVTGSLVILRDITKRVRTENALRESEVRLRTLQEYLPNGILLIDAETHVIIDANPAAISMIGASYEQVIGSVCHNYVCPTEKGSCPITDLGQTVDSSERVLIKASGESIPILKTVASIMLDNRQHILESIIDITERKQAEEDLQHERDFAESLIETAQTIVLVLDTEGRIVRFNPYLEKLSGYSLAEVQGREWFGTFLPEKDRRCMQKVFSKAIGNIPTRGKVNPIVTKDGHERIIEWSDKTLKDAEGNVVGLLSIGQDITDRVQAEEDLRRTEKRYRAVVEDQTEMIVRHLPDGTVTFVNKAYCRNAGKKREELLGRNYRDRISEEDLEIAQAHLTSLNPEIPITTYQHQITGPDGEIRRQQWTSRAIFDDQSNIIEYQTIGKDITDRVRAEEKLRRLKEFNEGIVQGVEEALLIEDASSIITFVNPAMERLVGYTSDELIGFHWRKIVAKGELEVVQAKTSHHSTGVKDLYETRLQSKDGRAIPVLISASPLFEERTFRGILSAFTDITDRKKAEEQLQRYSAELEQANEEVKNFAYIVSHDLRAPLVNLKGFAAELRSSLEVIDPAMNSVLSHLDEAQRQEVILALQEDIPEALEFIESSVTRMDHFIGAVLKLSRVGRRQLRSEPVDMNALVHEALQTVTHQLDEHHSKVTVEPLPDVVADRTSMEQIIGNILGNAVKYLNGNRPGEIIITAERNSDETTFHIRDNGRGISEADMHKVFAPFRRAGKQDVPGEGMGLTYVQTLVRRHGGRIWCESELGVGTTFSFTISNDLVKGSEDA